MKKEADQSDYDNLPEGIKATMSRKEYAWLTDEQKAHFVENECLPDDMEDDIDDGALI